MSRYNSTVASRAHFVVAPAVPDIGVDANNNTVTLFARFKAISTGSVDVRFIASGSSSSQSEHRIMLGMGGSNLRSRIRRDSTALTLVSSPAPQTGIWNTGAVTSNGSWDYLYLNGGVITSGANTGDLTGENGWPLHLGNMPGYAQSSMQGYLMDCAIWNAALTADEIAALNSGVRPGDIQFSALSGWWPMEGDDPPAVVRDYSRWRRHGIHSQTVYGSDTSGSAGVSVWERSNDQPLALQPLKSRRTIFLPAAAPSLPWLDTFTVGADVALSTYDANYQRADGYGGALEIAAATDRVTYTGTADNIVRWVGVAAQLDMKVSALCNSRNAYDYDGGAVAVRVQGSGSETGYLITRANGSTLTLWRMNAGTWTSLQNYVGTWAAQLTLGLNVTGSGATVTLTPYVNGTPLTPYADTSVDRIVTAGYGGFQVYSSGDGGPSTENWIDDFTVEDASLAAYPVLSLAELINLTQTQATPRVTVTVP